MKIKLHSLVLRFTLGLMSMLSFSQCPTTSITLNSQAEIDAFTTNYPGCTMLTERLTISGADITNLAPLSNVTYIPYLRIIDNPLLIQLDGLHNLQSSVSNSTALQLEDNPLITSLSVFTNLTLLSHLNIQGCHSLATFQGLQFVTNFDSMGFGGVYTGINISNNLLLTDISALGNITDANIDIGMYPFFINISDNPLLNSLNGLQPFEGYYDYLHITNNDSLINLTGLSDFGVENNIVISDNDMLQNLGNIEGSYFLHEIIIDNNPMLDDISAFNNFPNAIPFLEITNNPNLAICNNIPFCASINELQFATDLYPLFTIENNAEGCNSVGEVANLCGFIPFNDECDSAFPLAIGETLETYNEYGTASSQVPNCNDVNRIDVWFKFNSSSYTSIDIVAEAGYSLQLWQGDCSSLIQLTDACAEYALTDIPVATNTDYYLQVWSDSEAGRATGLFDVLVQDGTLANEDFVFKDFTLYPNPTNDILNLKSKNKMDLVKVYNLLGQQISSSKPNSLVGEINMSELNTGIYLISVEMDGHSFIKRVIKE